MTLAIITARGGSRRIPRKNIRPFLGKPMIAWSIEAAKKAGCFAHILVSTDDEEIASVSLQYGAEVPFMRPENLADDFTHAHVAAKHALEWAIENWGPVPEFCHIYPCAPMLPAAKIREGLELIRKGASNAYAMQRVPFPIYQVLVRNSGGRLEALFPPEKAALRSQDMPEAFVDAGQMYWFKTEYFLSRETAIGPETAVVEMPREACIDIDTPEDWVFAERLASFSGALKASQNK